MIDDKFYEQAAILDRLKSTREPTASEVTQVLELLGEESYSRYFFHDLANPAWLKPLRDSGFFSKPPDPILTEEGFYRIPRWEASEYLVRVANVHPDIAVDIALEIETENFRVLRDLVQAGMRMPAAEASRMVPAVIRWLESRFQNLIPKYAADLMVHLAEGDQWDTALELLQALTEPVIDKPREQDADRAEGLLLPEAKPRYKKYLLEEILEEQAPQLIIRRPFAVLATLENQLTKAVELEQELGRREKSTDGSIMWRSAIEDHPQNSRIKDIKKLLTEGLRNTLEEAVQQDPDEARDTVMRYLEHPYSIFRRLAIHIIRLHPDQYRDFLIQLLNNRKSLDDTNIHHEFYLLMESAFDRAPPEVQQCLLEWITEGEPPERLERSMQVYRERMGEEAPADLVQRWREGWTLMRLWALRNYDLPRKYRSELERLVTELGEPEHPDFLTYYRTSWTGPTSPLSIEDSIAMSPAELLDYIKEYRPPGEYSAPSREGLGRLLRDVVQNRAQDYAAIAPRFLEWGIRPIYIHHLLWGLEEAWKSGKEFDWTPVLTLCEGVIHREDEPQDEHQRRDFEANYTEVRRQVASLLTEGVGREDHAIPEALLTRVRDVLRTLIRDVNPTPEYELQYGGDNMDPATLSLNTVRGKAMHALIAYALRRARFVDGQAQAEEEVAPAQRLEPEVREALAEKLDKTKDRSQAVHSVFGWYLPNLYYLDREWLTEYLPQIFPAQADKQAYWRAAWNSYVSFNPLYSDLYGLLRVEYRRAVEQLSEEAEGRAGFERAGEHLAGHMMVAYWRGLEQLEGDNGLLPLFYEKAPEDVRAHAVWFLWRGLEEVKPSAGSEIWQRLRRLWETRVIAASQAQDPLTFSQELSAFAWWLGVAPEGLDSLYPLIEAIVPHLEKGAHTSDVIEYLTAQVEDHPGPATCLLLAIIQQEEQPVYRGQEETYTILKAAMKSGDEEACSCAEIAINLLGERGQYEWGQNKYRDLLKLKPGT